MATYTGVSDGNGDFTVPFPTNYTGGQKVTVTAEKDAAEKTIELFAPSELIGEFIKVSGSFTSFPNNIGDLEIGRISGGVGNYAFSGNPTGVAVSPFWRYATGLKIHEGVTSAGISSFEYWRSAIFLDLPTTLTTIGTNAFRNWSSATSLTVNQHITSIGSTAFSSWAAATILDMSNSVLTTINTGSFSGWSSCTLLNLPPNLTNIGSEGFRGFSSLTSLTLPSSLSSIGSLALEGLVACNEINCLSTTPPTISSNTFTNLKSTCVIKVPSASLTAYQTAANWSAHASKMVGV